MEIDIAVDLHGFTSGGRPGVFAMRAAPLQVNYLGYPGTMAAEYMDYVVADRTVIPEASRRHFQEKIIYLPDSYQVNDARRPISDRIFERAACGLPAEGFIFCCFNSSYKITPTTFDGWMRILKRVEGSVLWLLDSNRTAVDNLRREAVRRGVAAERLVFAARVPMAEHLARHRLADLCLDTLPYNAHTTASDALWAGLPVLTRAGEAFAARVAASLLSAANLPELVASSQAQYEDVAAELAVNRVRLAMIKQKLNDNRLSAALFDTRLYARHLETAYRKIYERNQAGYSPDHIYLDRD
jgi:predicted O-linked N-acetylglucosamine transferase (SPINDLY family)